MAAPTSFERVPEHQRAELKRHLEEHQMKDTLRMYNYLVQSCFDKCVNVGWNGGFQSKTLDDAENKCISHCAEKLLKTTQRVGFRFAEQTQGGGALPKP